MLLPVGTRIGPYEIIAPIGAGGMGEVYRARDTKLDRDVAIKILPDSFALDPDRLMRFDREAKTLASLNHPNIAAIYGVEDRALVMELVDGDDLAVHLRRGAIPFPEALPMARQIAEALEAAHDAGIIHRDLKPANIKVRANGVVKVLDFGLAKALDSVGSSAPSAVSSPTMTSPMTAMGMVLGTAAYMSPEQAKGVAVDRRADIWAFGVVLYEMLSGRYAFARASVTETLAAVMRDDPDVTALPPDVPDGIRRLIERCLRKDPRARLRDIGDARLELEDPTLGRLPGTAPRSRRPTVMAALPWAIAAVLATALVVWPRGPRSSGSDTPVRRFAIDIPWHSAPNWTDFGVALSPTSTHFAYHGRRRNDNDSIIYVRALDSLEAKPLDGVKDAATMTFSPDGEWLALLDWRGLRKVSIHGGPARALAQFEATPPFDVGLSWGSDGAILIGHPSGLLRVPSAGGRAERLTRIDAGAKDTGHYHPAPLPGGTHVLMTVARGEQKELAVVTLADGSYRRLSLAGGSPAYLPSGHVVFRQGASILAAAFDVQTMTLAGEAVPVIERVRSGPYVASDGTLLYVPERGDSNARLVWVDRTGRPTPITGERLDYSHLALGSRGQALLNIAAEVHVRDIERGTRRRLSSLGWYPIWSPDGRWATFTTEESGLQTIVRQPADGSGSPETLVTSSEDVPATSWNSRTGELAYFDTASDIWIVRPGTAPKRLLATAANERSGRFSPDGNWLAYVSDETGVFQVYVVPYPGPGPKIAVSVEGGLSPLWSVDGREIFFRRGGRVFASTLAFTPGLSASTPVLLFDGPYTPDLQGHQRYDVAPDGRFLMVENSDPFRAVLIQGWAREVTNLLPGAAR